MRPISWHPPVEISSGEQTIMKHIKRAKLDIFLRYRRHEIFDDTFQEEMAALYAPSLRGQPPIPPAQLALATILQAYTGVSDDEVIEATLMDRRWQLVLDCLDTEHAPFSKGTLVAFRKRLIGDHSKPGELDSQHPVLNGLGGWDLEVVERQPGTRGFSVLPRRWVVERTLSWISPQ